MHKTLWKWVFFKFYKNHILDPVDGVWKEWGEWDECSRDCGGGGGTRSKSRDCNGPFYGGSDCVGDIAVTEECNKEPCPGIYIFYRFIICCIWLKKFESKFGAKFQNYGSN